MTAIKFIPKDLTNPLTAMAAEFWDGEVSVTYNRTFGNRVDVQYKHSQAALCAKYGIKNPPALRRAQESLGYPSLPIPNCSDCSGALQMQPRWSPPCKSREAFRADADQWANELCQNCTAARKAAKVKAAEERKAEAEANRERLRKRYGAQYVKDCPACDGVLYLRAGRHHGSVFIACSGFYEGCTHREPMLAPVPAPSATEIERVKAEMAAAATCPKCSLGKLRKVNGAHGPFLGCTTYPACRFTQNIPVPQREPSGDELVGRFE